MSYDSRFCKGKRAIPLRGKKRLQRKKKGQPDGLALRITTINLKKKQTLCAQSSSKNNRRSFDSPPPS
jgi:hypothetical protein